ncbi:hypothetical protein TELCIR_14863, partial [Teladorsagia circumcincta]
MVIRSSCAERPAIAEVALCFVECVATPRQQFIVMSSSKPSSVESSIRSSFAAASAADAATSSHSASCYHFLLDCDARSDVPPSSSSDAAAAAAAAARVAVRFCYFKKLHNAAIVVQKHFRLKKMNQGEHPSCPSTEVPEHPTLNGQSIRIQVPQNSSSLLREHRAATTIQLAYRGHRKRQAAARKIQKFMKESRM